MQNLIENAIKEKLNGEKNALDFVAFLQANAISADIHDSGDGWSVMYKGESIGFIIITGGATEGIGPWTIWLNVCDFGDPSRARADGHLQEIAWKHTNVCGHFTSGGKNCGCGDQPGRRVTIFGKDFDNICHSPLMFINPDADKLDAVKKLLLLVKRNRDDGNM